MYRTIIAGLGLMAIAFITLGGLASAQKKESEYRPEISPASDEGQKAIKSFQVANGLQIELTAAEPLLANPVAFCIDHQGNFYVAETFRLHSGVTDNRSHQWTERDLASRTVQDRVDMYRKYLGKKFASYAVDHDRVRKLIDTNDDGKPDKATVFADGFNNHEDGIGSGVLARGSKVWYTCIPDVWLLEDTNGDGKADVKKSLHTGYGIHVAFLGHDSHGLIMGPDGKLYFSIGDRGLHVVVGEKVLSVPDTGSVLRCNPDGSDLEIVHSGLRNPQELAFDEHGNLFTGDNNADAGDQARWVHVVEGGDSGWRIGYQYLNAPPARLGPWKAERMWELRNPDQPAYILPPLAHIGSGPSGLAYHPGVSQLPEKYKKHFFLCDFRGGPGNSTIHTFQVKEKGATFEVVNQDKIISNVLPTDVDFGPDGGLYLSDWVQGWRTTGKGRIYKLYDPARVNNAKVTETKKLLNEGMTERSNDALGELLAHDDMRVRTEAQFTLASRGMKGLPVLASVARRSDNLLARLHGIWGIGQLADNQSLTDAQRLEAGKTLYPLAKDEASEVRAQMAKVLRKVRNKESVKILAPMLSDDSPRVRFQAAMSLGKLGDTSAVPSILDMLRANADADVYLRHAGVMALTWLQDSNGLSANAKDSSAAVRLASLLAMRREKSPEIAMFLNDADPRLVLEAARAINDEPIEKAFPALAALANRTGQPNALTYRALNAHFRIGGKENALALARYAANTNAPELMRLEAIKHLGNWANPPGLDRVVGLWRPLQKRSKEVAANAMSSALGGIFSGGNRIRTEGAKVAAQLGIKEVGPALFEIIENADAATIVRVESLRALASLKDDRLGKALQTALTSKDARLRAEGRLLLAKQNPQNALPEISQALKSGATVEKQLAFAALGSMKMPKARAILEEWMGKLIAGDVPASLQLDVLQAARENGGSLEKLLQKYNATIPMDDLVAKYRACLEGGDAEEGRRIFLERTELSCVRCHKISGMGGGDVGPELSDIGKKQKRSYILEAIVAPSKQIAKGYDQMTLVLTNGKVQSGILKSESKNAVQLMTAEGTLLTIPTNEIDERLRASKSAMPEDLLQRMSPADVRNLVEFLSQRK